MQIPLDTKYTKYMDGQCKYFTFLKKMQLTCTASVRFAGHKQRTVDFAQRKLMSRSTENSTVNNYISCQYQQHCVGETGHGTVIVIIVLSRDKLGGLTGVVLGGGEVGLLPGNTTSS